MGGGEIYQEQDALAKKQASGTLLAVVSIDFVAKCLFILDKIA